MTTWVLIVLLWSSGGGYALESVRGFGTLEECNAAGAAVKKFDPGADFHATCVKQTLDVKLWISK